MYNPQYDGTRLDPQIKPLQDDARVDILISQPQLVEERTPLHIYSN